MNLNERNISEIAKQLGLSGRNGVDKKEIENLATKSDKELEREILKLREKLKANNISYEQQIALINSISPMLDSRQRERLNRVIALLKR